MVIGIFKKEFLNEIYDNVVKVKKEHLYICNYPPVNEREGCSRFSRDWYI